jgi:NADPH2:quinone reductase
VRYDLDPLIRGARVFGFHLATMDIRQNSSFHDRAVAQLIEDPAMFERVKALTNNRGAPVIIDMDFSATSTGFAEGLLAHHGTVVCYGSNNLEVPINFRVFLFASVAIKFFLVYDLTPEDRELLQNQIDTLLSKGQLVHTIGQRFPLEQVAQAHELVETGQEIGNVIIDL